MPQNPSFPRRLLPSLTPIAAILAALLATPARADSYTASDYASLVQAIDAANAADSRAEPHLITLTADITLDGPLPLILCNTTIDGQGHTLDGAGQYRLLFVGVDPATQASVATQFPDSALGQRLAVDIENLTLAQGNASGGNGSGQSGGGLGAGGALFVNGAADVTLADVAFSGNQANGGGGGAGSVGGGGGLGGFGGGGGGGGIFGRGGVSGGGVFGNGAKAYAGGEFDPGGAGGGGYTGNGGDSNNALPQPGSAGIFGLFGSGGSGSGDGTANGDAGAADGGGGGGGVNAGGGGGGGFGAIDGSTSDPDEGTNGNGGDAGFGGGGGASGGFGGNGGQGGFGGGGGYGPNADDADAAAGGFGGGGGFGGHGGFGGGGGGYGGAGGFGGGGGNQAAPGGFGGGTGGNAGALSTGGGGAGLGGALFVVDGGTLRFSGNGSIDGGAAAAGPAGNINGDTRNATDGEAFGAGLFLQGSSGDVVFALGAGSIFTIDDAIADEAGSNASASSNARGITIAGDGTVVVGGAHGYAGATNVTGGRLEVDGALPGAIALSGGTLAGSGEVGSIHDAAGTVEPGTPAQPHAALHVDGDAGFDGGAHLHLHLDPGSPAVPLIVAGHAGIGGQAVIDFDGAQPAIGSSYTLLTAAQIDGGFSGLALPDGVYGRFVYASDSVSLEITEGPIDLIFIDGFDGNAPH